MQTFSVIEKLYVAVQIRLYIFYCSIFSPQLQDMSCNWVISFLSVAKKLSTQELSYGHPGALMEPSMPFSASILLYARLLIDFRSHFGKPVLGAFREEPRHWQAPSYKARCRYFCSLHSRSPLCFSDP